MTIKPGEEWGRDAPLPDGAPVFDNDADLRQHIEVHRRSGADVPPVGLIGGDLWTTMGAPVGGVTRLRSHAARTAPIDIASILVDGRQCWFGSHLVARRSWWRGRILVVLNAEWLGGWDLGPRSHPNDGRVDVYETTMSMSQRWKAKKRLATGSHLPHPDISSQRVKAFQTTLDPPLALRLDGVSIGDAKHITVRVEPDALLVTV